MHLDVLVEAHVVFVEREDVGADILVDGRPAEPSADVLLFHAQRRVEVSRQGIDHVGHELGQSDKADVAQVDSPQHPRLKIDLLRRVTEIGKRSGKSVNARMVVIRRRQAIDRIAQECDKRGRMKRAEIFSGENVTAQEKALIGSGFFPPGEDIGCRQMVAIPGLDEVAADRILFFVVEEFHVLGKRIGKRIAKRRPGGLRNMNEDQVPDRWMQLVLIAHNDRISRASRAARAW